MFKTYEVELGDKEEFSHLKTVNYVTPIHYL